MSADLYGNYSRTSGVNAYDDTFDNTFTPDGGGCVPGEVDPFDPFGGDPYDPHYPPVFPLDPHIGEPAQPPAEPPDPGSPGGLANPVFRSYFWDRFMDVANPSQIIPAGQQNVYQQLINESLFYGVNPLEFPIPMEERAGLEAQVGDYMYELQMERSREQYRQQAVEQALGETGNKQAFDNFMAQFKASGGTDMTALTRAAAVMARATGQSADRVLADLKNFLAHLPPSAEYLGSYSWGWGGATYLSADETVVESAGTTATFSDRRRRSLLYLIPRPALST